MRLGRGTWPASSAAPRSERGLTLAELTVIGLLATMVMLALTAFYFDSQRLWMDGSTKAIAQRDATMLVEDMRRHVNEAHDAAVDATSDPLHHVLTLSYANGGPSVQFRWHASDSRVHLEVGGVDQGAAAESPVSRFLLTTRGADIVELALLEMRSDNGDSVRVSSRFALLGR